jgi:hypothetical protein
MQAIMQSDARARAAPSHRFVAQRNGVRIGTERLSRAAARERPWSRPVARLIARAGVAQRPASR